MESTTTDRISLRRYAETILYSDRLADKLIVVGRFEDHDPGLALTAPRFPVRPKEIDLELNRHRAKVPFPTLRDLEEERFRGYVMHFFANHELLALELMALVLLRFPDAPTSFRRGIAQTMQEEQTHMRLYLERMRETGVEFGEIPVNDFFWNCIADMRDPLDFVARMSLTFEQANLDYSLYYQKAFGTLGDARTTEILDTVYRDEVGHVKHGLVWFNRWRDPRETEWESYVKHLEFPLSPARAKGLEFDIETRRQIGFSEAFITRLELFSQSKGRPPRVFVFDPSVESYVAEAGRTYNPGAAAERLRRDLELVPIFLAAADDVVLVERPASDAFLLGLR
ncbi:MAG: DUF455 family protein, partial [Myxococcales bacterium]|nr:DUF455 family protein [Myxococcales bacterium]